MRRGRCARRIAPPAPYLAQLSATTPPIPQPPNAAPLGALPSLIALFALCLAASAGCGSTPPPVPTPSPAVLFGPVSMRIHPIFTQIKDWTGTGVPTGIEALLEFEDQFGDPCKAAGRVIFELYNFNKFDPERKGSRIVNPYVGDLSTVQAQRDRWNRTSRTYTFQLFYYNIPTDKNYVLTAVFQGDDGSRFFDQIILEAQPPPTSRPTTTPGTPIGPSFGPPPQPASATPGPTTRMEPGMRTPQP